MKQRIGVVLCGCGHRDGSEVHEATLTLLAIDRAGAEAICFAPQGAQRCTSNHLSGKNVDEERDMLVESARIARGKIQPLSEAKADDLDALIIPGGQGAAKNLSTYLVDGTNGSVNAPLTTLIEQMLHAQKPIGAICIAPATLALALAQLGVKATLTAGTDDAVGTDIETLGHHIEKAEATDCVIDGANRIVTTPAYMNARSIGEVWEGIEKLVGAIVEMSR